MDNVQLTAVWEQILHKLESEIIKPLFDTWLRGTVALSMQDNILEIGTPKAITKEWLETKYLPQILNAIEYVLKEPVKVRFTSLNIVEQEEVHYTPTMQTETNTISDSIPLVNSVEKNPAFSINKIESASSTPISQTAAIQQPIQNQSPSYVKNAIDDAQVTLNPKYVFESFVVGNSNRFAHAVSLAVAESPAKSYNPLFIYGGVGLGKTHLMHAIGHRILQNYPNLKVVYISSEKFTNELINSLRDNKPESFRQRYRNIDVLLVDDIQFLSKKEHTQEEFFHTFNTLHEANKQIIISSDRPPREIQTLEDRLRSRFQMGLITDIQVPDLETRIAILRKKAQLENFTVPNDVMVYIASYIDNNIRELEGALIRVMAYSSLTAQPVDVILATEALKDILPNGSSRQVNIELIQEVVASHYKLKIDELIAKKRTRNVAYPRQIAMYLCRELTETSLPRIGEMFGGRDHTTVIHAYDKITRERNEDAKLNNTIKELIKEIEGI